VELLQSSWGVRNFEERLKNDRKNLADEIVRVIHENVAFQSVTVLDDIHKRPTLLSTKVPSVVTGNHTAPNNHVLLLIDGIENESNLHLVDCGTGFPTFRTISLNFSEESPIFTDGFLEYKYIRFDGKILRMHGEGDTFKRNNPPIEGLDFFIGRWRRFYSFDPDHRPRDPHKPADDVYRTVAAGLTTFTSTSPRAVWFPRKRAVAIANNKLFVENETGELVTTHLNSDEEILKAFQEHFPQFKQDTVRRALAEWNRVSQ
ncbi:arylamine N-acetyltransferase 1-like, partial [Paramuricea clavata]